LALHTHLGDGPKQITPFFFTILSILWLDPITGYKLNSAKGVIMVANLSFAAPDGCEAKLDAVKHSLLALQLSL
jgi:hypothetical protein